MIKIKKYDMSAKEIGHVQVSKEKFDRPYNESLIHQVVVAQLANKRQGTKSTLTRSEVRGGGAKPWRQKGTGRARQGSIRSPQWVKGGVVFAPKPRDFTQKINKKMKESALYSVLSEKIRNDEIVVINDIKTTGKTKEIINMFKAFAFTGRALILVKDEENLVYQSTRNIQKVKTIPSELINVYDIVNCSKMFITVDALEQLTV